ncbi:MAG: thiol peroxidase [Lentisphaeria bacterium]|nr:thiol peroxidase [Lentisphaeria bacterium]
MMEREGLVTLLGNPVTLCGEALAVGGKAPEFEVSANDLSPVKLSDSAGKVRLLVAVPSLDTPVCDTETRTFNKAAADLGDDVEILVVSMDLPFAQARWCGAAGVDAVTTLSDHKTAEFGEAYGLLIKEVRLLARAVLVVGRNGDIVYQELVSEVADEPNYEAALAAVKKAL